MEEVQCVVGGRWPGSDGAGWEDLEADGEAPMAAPTTRATGWPAGRIARGYAGFGLTPGTGLVVFGTSIEWLAVGYGDLPALDGAEIRHIV